MADVPLPELLQQAAANLGRGDRPLSIQQAAKRANGLTNYETIRQTINGEHSGLYDDKTLDGIAKAYSLDVTEVRRAAFLYSGRRLGPFELPDRAHRLTRRQRQAVLGVVDAMLAPEPGQRADLEEPHRPDVETVLGDGVPSPTRVNRRKSSKSQ